MDNFSKFNISSQELSNYMNNVITKLITDNDLDSKDKIIFISGPVTGIENYKEEFNDFKKLIEYVWDQYDVYIINPNEIIDAIPEEYNPTYIDKVIFGLRLTRICDMVYVNDSKPKAWEYSRGSLLEILHSIMSGIDIYNFDYLINEIRAKSYIMRDFDSNKWLEEYFPEVYNEIKGYNN